MKEKLKIYWSLFLSFLKIGLFTFGGGYAMIALIEKEFVDRKKCLSHDEFMDLVVIAESTPGPIAINSATYIGHKVGKIWGAIFATLAVCIPSFVIIFAISLFFDAFLKLKFVAYAFKGIQACVIYLIFSVGFKMLKKMNKDFLSISLVILTMAAYILISLFAVNFSTIFFILIGAVVGLIFYSILHAVKNKKEIKKEEN